MKKVLIAAAALAVVAMPGFVGASSAAPAAKSEYCKYMGAQKNPVAWDFYYHCNTAAVAPSAKRTRVARARTGAMHARAEAKSPFCKYASAQKNLVAWNAYYHCLSR